MVDVTPKFPEVLLGQQTVPIHLPTIRFVECTFGLYQRPSDYAVAVRAQRAQNENDILIMAETRAYVEHTTATHLPTGETRVHKSTKANSN